MTAPKIGSTTVYERTDETRSYDNESNSRKAKTAAAGGPPTKSYSEPRPSAVRVSAGEIDQGVPRGGGGGGMEREVDLV